jgi:hypothetical protein
MFSSLSHREKSMALPNPFPPPPPPPPPPQMTEDSVCRWRTVSNSLAETVSEQRPQDFASKAAALTAFVTETIPPSCAEAMFRSVSDEDAATGVGIVRESDSLMSLMISPSLAERADLSSERALSPDRVSVSRAVWFEVSDA